jgi:hypothetical protein
MYLFPLVSDLYFAGQNLPLLPIPYSLFPAPKSIIILTRCKEIDAENN